MKPQSAGNAPGVPGSERTRLASAGARAVTLAQLNQQPRGDRFVGTIFLTLLLFAVSLALLGLVAPGA